MDKIELEGLTHKCLSATLEFVVWIFDTFDHNFELNNGFVKYVKPAPPAINFSLSVSPAVRFNPLMLNPSNAEATFLRCTRMQIFLKTI